jgi:hypothetical protein
MPVRNSIADRINETRIILKTALIRNNKMAKDVEKRKIMNANTFYVKQAKTDRLKLSDLWRLDDMLHFTDEEILKMFGKGVIKLIGAINSYRDLRDICRKYSGSCRDCPLGKEEDIMDTHCPRLTEPRSWSNEKITDMVGKIGGAK